MDRLDKLEICKALEILYGSWDLSGFVELRILDPKRLMPPASRSVEWDPYNQGGVADELLAHLRELGTGNNCYVGRSLRTHEGYGSAESVSYVTCVSLDIDCVRETTAPASGPEMERALRAMGAHGPTGPATVMTGNGYQLWWPLSQPVDVRGRREWWSRAQAAWEKAVTKELPSEYCKVDPQADLPRIVKLPGTVAYKGVEEPPERPYRMARVLSSSSKPLDPDVIMDYATVAATRSSSDVSLKPTAVPERFWRLIATDQRLKEAWSGARADLQDNSQSAQDMALVGRLRSRGFTPDETYSILRASPFLNRKGNNQEHYLRLTVSKAYGGTS